MSLNKKTTKDFYCVDGNYIDDRLRVHKQIVNYFYNNDVNTKEPPQAILLGGGSASGKSTLRKMWFDAYEREGIPLTSIDCDEIKMLIPDYEKIKKYNEELAAFQVHDESSDIAELLLNKCIDQGKNFLYDGTMKNLEKYKKIITRLKEAGYTIAISVVDVPLDVAKERALGRYLQTGRKVPEEIIEESHKKVPKSFYVLKEMADEYILFDTSGIEPEVILEKDTEGNINIYDEVKLKRFYQKSN